MDLVWYSLVGKLGLVCKLHTYFSVQGSVTQSRSWMKDSSQNTSWDGAKAAEMSHYPGFILIQS